MSWSLADIEKLKAAGKIRDYTVMSKNDSKPSKSSQIVKKCEGKQPKALQVIMQMLQDCGHEFETEYHFHDKRKFRFDIAILKYKVAIEYEGIVAGKSRHTSITGYTRDATKYNLAQAAGWKVLRYTVLNYKEAENDLKSIINQNQK